MRMLTTVALSGLALAGGLTLLRLLRGRSVADRIVALDLLLLIGASAMAVGSIRTGSGAFVNALVVVALVAFVGTVTVARFMERRGA